MRHTTPTAAPLSPHWAFVVQLREGTALTSQALQGRAEHISSGRVADFCSLDALLAFMVHVLTPLAEPPPWAVDGQALSACCTSTGSSNGKRHDQQRCCYGYP